MKIYALQHVPFEGPAYFETWAEKNGHEITCGIASDLKSFPHSKEIDLLLVMGGPMSVYEEDKYAWLREEKKWLRSLIEEGKPIIGICLGAQLLADTLGASVYPNSQKEIGWHSVQQTTPSTHFASFPDSFMAFHWHGDTFDIPAGANRLLKSDATLNQAFSYEKHVLALQFHLESTHESINALLNHCSEDLTEGPFVSQKTLIQENLRLVQSMHKHFDMLMHNFLQGL